MDRKIPFLLAILVLGIFLGGCVVPIPVPLPVPVPPPVQTGQQGLPQMGAPSGTMHEAASITTVPTEGPSPAGIAATETGTPAPVPTTVFVNPLTRGMAFAYADNINFHALSVAVGNSQMRTAFYYTPGGSGNPAAKWEAAPGNKFLLVGVDFYMTGIRREGKSSLFMTPLATSFQLLKGGDSYGVLNASDIPDMTDYYIRDVGSMYRDRFIDKDDDGSGVLIFMVPQSFDPTGAYVTFCPRNLDSWAMAGYYRSPDNWNCEKNLVVWQLR